ncbi:unnamed protein product [Polarella glacialis]|uniref:Uncharacterized protein n=1 Tax=Polarella glacialis TaxID=89957 RepID=A0A813L573_POLGL|nr:unnamed protein product [Polarella glacialis]CAE8719962.1 unnamed protein product [Polarella glacialis]|mmetsp:Transcript_50259/g.81452  ORF Transcript_50259/g.81452 Transcript_50259/m.81452 type:complete len:191 (+) Transcript_50259:72-644(+)
MDEGQKAAAVSLAKEFSANAVGAASEIAAVMREYIQRGPEGIGWLCFIGGLTTFAFGLLGFINIFDAVLEPLQYLVNIYQMAFGLTVCVIEAPPEWVDKSEKLKNAQRFISEFAKFLSTFGGRGLFYLFQGSLSASLTSLSLSWLLGMYMCGLGLLCVAMQYGFKPDLSFLRRGQRQHTFERAGDYIHVT